MIELNLLDNRDARRFCFNLQDVDSWVESHFKPKMVEFFRAKKYNINNKWCFDQRRGRFVTFFERHEELADKCKKYFEENHSPIFLSGGYRSSGGEKHTIVYNAPLKEVEFYRVFDPYSAFQELSMYMANIAIPMKPIPPISDADMVGIKGFDKFSFRKGPSKEKK